MSTEKENQTSADAVAEEAGDFVKANPELNPRTQQMAEIAARSNAARIAESQETAPTVNESGEPTEPEQTLEEAGAEATAAAEAAETAVETATEGSKPAAAAPAQSTPAQSPIDPNADYEITVEGQKIKVKGAKIVERGFAALQKESTADYRLQLASQALAEAERIRSTAQPAAQAPAALPVTGAPAQAQATALSDADLAQLIQFGNPQQAAEAVKALRARDSSTVTPEGMQQFIARTIPQMVDAQLAFKEGATFARTEYEDLLKDPYLKELFFLREDQARKAGDKRPYKELYKAIGDDIRTHFNRPAAAPTQPAPTMQQRTDAKAKAPAAPKLAAARLEGGAGAQKPQTREEIIEGMRQRRGQTSLNRI
jgi:hypothetical protein